MTDLNKYNDIEISSLSDWNDGEISVDVTKWNDFDFPSVPAGGDRGVMCSASDKYDYITISTTGDGTYFGAMSGNGYRYGSTSNGSSDRLVTNMGNVSGSWVNTIDYVTISTTSDSSDYGDLTRKIGDASCYSNGTNDRGVWGRSGTYDYCTISTTGNCSNTGTASYAIRQSGGCSNGTNERGISIGGYVGGAYSNIIEYMTISTMSNGTDFGDLHQEHNYAEATSNGTDERAIGGHGLITGTTAQADMSYWTINSPANAGDQGDLTRARANGASCDSRENNRSIFAGGNWGGGGTDIDYYTTNSTGAASDFGDCSATTGGLTWGDGEGND